MKERRASYYGPTGTPDFKDGQRQRKEAMIREEGWGPGSETGLFSTTYSTLELARTLAANIHNPLFYRKGQTWKSIQVGMIFPEGKTQSRPLSFQLTLYYAPVITQSSGQHLICCFFHQPWIPQCLAHTSSWYMHISWVKFLYFSRLKKGTRKRNGPLLNLYYTPDCRVCIDTEQLILTITLLFPFWILES